jgi:hypothetical protein
MPTPNWPKRGGGGGQWRLRRVLAAWSTYSLSRKDRLLADSSPKAMERCRIECGM